MREVRLIRTRSIIDEGSEFLHRCGGQGSPVESYITQHALVVLCAELESQLTDVVHCHAAAHASPLVAAYVKDSCPRMLGSLSKGDVAKFMELFGDEVKAAFNAKVDDRLVGVYSIALRGRQDVAHRQGVEVSFADLTNAVDAGEHILQAVADALEACAKRGASPS